MEGKVPYLFYPLPPPTKVGNKTLGNFLVVLDPLPPPTKVGKFILFCRILGTPQIGSIKTFLPCQVTFL